MATGVTQAQAAYGCGAATSKTVTDTYHGWTWNTVWYCTNHYDPGASSTAMYADANYGTVTGYMKSTYSWFVCWRAGAMHSGGNDVWYYSQGDVDAAGQSARHAWGFMPAVRVSTTVDPLPGMPQCPAAPIPTPPSASPTPPPIPPAYDTVPSISPGRYLYSVSTSNLCGSPQSVDWGNPIPITFGPDPQPYDSVTEPGSPYWIGDDQHWVYEDHGFTTGVEYVGCVNYHETYEVFGDNPVGREADLAWSCIPDTLSCLFLGEVDTPWYQGWKYYS